MKVLFVCTANICRSPFLELSARALAGDADLEFSSAGTQGWVDQPMSPEMAGLLPAGTANGFRSRRLDATILREADLVLTAEAAHRAHILEEHPQHFRKVFTVGQLAAFATEHPELRGRELVEAAGKRRTAARPEHDIADPYRRGIAAAEAAAGTISTMLSVIVPRLGGHDT
jgi:protein-tyrosine-phosphatase